MNNLNAISHVATGSTFSLSYFDFLVRVFVQISISVNIFFFFFFIDLYFDCTAFVNLGGTISKFSGLGM